MHSQLATLSAGYQSMASEFPVTQPLEQPEMAVTCRSCGHQLTYRRHLFQLQGSSEATFRNPAGYSFHVALFKEASGALVEGASFSEHSWFAGYNWSIGICGNCRSHIGWRFDGGDQFWGLIVTRLAGYKKI